MPGELIDRFRINRMYVLLHRIFIHRIVQRETVVEMSRRIKVIQWNIVHRSKWRTIQGNHIVFRLFEIIVNDTSGVSEPKSGDFFPIVFQAINHSGTKIQIILRQRRKSTELCITSYQSVSGFIPGYLVDTAIRLISAHHIIRGSCVNAQPVCQSPVRHDLVD